MPLQQELFWWIGDHNREQRLIWGDAWNRFLGQIFHSSFSPSNISGLHVWHERKISWAPNAPIDGGRDSWGMSFIHHIFVHLLSSQYFLESVARNYWKGNSHRCSIRPSKALSFQKALLTFVISCWCSCAYPDRLTQMETTRFLRSVEVRCLHRRGGDCQ